MCAPQFHSTLGDSGGNGGLWVNRGEEFANEWFKPLRFSVCDDTGAVIHQPVRGDSDIWVQIEADVGVQDSALTVGYALLC